MTTEFSFSVQPKYAYEIIPTTDNAPTKTFHTARYRARGLNWEMTIPELSTPMAEKTIPTVPVTRLQIERVLVAE
jgi:hypothetical protein